MSIKISTDIVLDVIRAADRQQSETAMAKLVADADRPRFSASVAPEPAVATDAHWRQARAGAAVVAQTPSQKLQALLLSKSIETMLSANGGSAFGKGFAGDYWRGVMAEQVATGIAVSGRLDLLGRSA